MEYFLYLVNLGTLTFIGKDLQNTPNSHVSTLGQILWMIFVSLLGKRGNYMFAVHVCISIQFMNKSK